MKVQVLPSPAAVAAAAAEHFIATAAMAMLAYGRCAVALAGGSTPETLYRLLATNAYRGQVDWWRMEVFFGDERCVAPGSGDSNYDKARTALLDHVLTRPGGIHPISARFAPEVGAKHYEDELKRFFGFEDRPPRFDFVLLGMGEDGHTASLFPGMPAVDETERWVVGTEAPSYAKPYVPRITLTLPVLNAAYMVLFLVTGKAKAERVRDVLSGREPGLPAARVEPTNGMLIWLLDEDAASLLERR